MEINKGFTLVELMTTLVVSTTLISIAVPNFNSLYDHYRADSAIRIIQQSLQFARNSAISYGTRVTACPVLGNQCTSNWKLGITIFIDSGESNVIDANDEILIKTSPFHQKDFISYNRRAVRFQADGLASGTNGTLKYCPSSVKNQYSRAVIVNQSGRVKFSKGKVIECN